MGPRREQTLNSPVAVCLGVLGKTTSRINNSRLVDSSATWVRILSRISLSKLEGYSDKARRINHNKAVRLVKVRSRTSKVEASSADSAKTHNKISNSKVEDCLVGLASRIKYRRLAAYPAA